MRATSLIAIIGIVASLAACVPPPTPTPPINSLAFQKRPPLPGRPGYLETIKYIGDGLHYILPNSDFYVSVAGDLCFRGVITPDVTPAYIPANFWCMSPFAVGRVELDRKQYQLHQPGSLVVPARRPAMRLPDRLSEHARKHADRQQHYHRNRAVHPATGRDRIPGLSDGREREPRPSGGIGSGTPCLTGRPQGLASAR